MLVSVSGYWERFRSTRSFVDFEKAVEVSDRSKRARVGRSSQALDVRCWRQISFVGHCVGATSSGGLGTKREPRVAGQH